MPRTFVRIPIAPGIYRDGYQLVADVRVGTAGNQTRLKKRFPLGTDVAVMQAWQYGAKEKLLLAAPKGPVIGSLADDIPIYLATLPEGRYRDDSTEIFQHWRLSPLAAKPRTEITRLELIAQISKWLNVGAAASTCNRRLSRLRKLYHALDGVTTANPTDAIRFQREPEKEARDIPFHVIDKILEALPDRGRAERFGTVPNVGLTKIRLRVMAWTGVPPATLARLRPRDLDLTRGRVYLRPRRKGQGTAGVWLDLLPQAVEAFRAFKAADLFGRPYSNASIGKTWRVGIKRALAAAVKDPALTEALEQLPPRCRPYDLRHSFGSEIYRQTGDIRAVAELLQHADMETTKRYTKGAVSARVSAAIKTVSANLAATAPPPQKAVRPLRLVMKRQS